MAVSLDNEVFALRDNESFTFFAEPPGFGRALAVMARTVEMPPGNRSPVRPCDGAPVEQAAILACEVRGADGSWCWCQIAPASKEVIGDWIFDHGLKKDCWYYMLVSDLNAPTQKESPCVS